MTNMNGRYIEMQPTKPVPEARTILYRFIIFKVIFYALFFASSVYYGYKITQLEHDVKVLDDLLQQIIQTQTSKDPFAYYLGDVVNDSEELGIHDRFTREVTEENPETETDSNVRTKRKDEMHLRKHYVKRSTIAAVHFNGYTPIEHPHVRPEGHMRHANYTYLHWKESGWVNRHNNHYFKMHNGVLEITEAGLYFIYAQIHFLTAHDSAGFQILKNNANLLSCMVTSLTHNNYQRPEKSNTCYTAGTEFLEVGDKISVRDINDYAYSKFETGKSFFGLIKLN